MSNEIESLILAKIDKIDTHLDKINDTLIQQHGTLEQHILRTQINEENISLLRKDVEPIKKHVWMIQGALKILGSLSVIGGIIKFLSMFKH